jgi:hypothetical protein
MAEATVRIIPCDNELETFKRGRSCSPRGTAADFFTVIRIGELEYR